MSPWRRAPGAGDGRLFCLWPRSKGGVERVEQLLGLAGAVEDHVEVRGPHFRAGVELQGHESGPPVFFREQLDFDLVMGGRGD